MKTSSMFSIFLFVLMAQSTQAGPGTTLQRQTREQIRILSQGKEVAIFHAGEALDKSYVHPLWTPDRSIVTYDAPADHVHHRGLSIGWPDINQTDFWAEVWSPAGRRGKIEVTNLDVQSLDDGSTRIVEQNLWKQENGTALLQGQHTWTFLPPQGTLQRLDVEIQLTALAEKVTFGTDPDKPRPYHGLTFRIGPLVNPHYFNSEGAEGGQNCQGAAARWCAVSGKQHGRSVLTAILDSPNNSSFPSRYYVQDRNMQFISSSPNYSQPKILKRGQTWHLQYRVIAAGQPPEGKPWNLNQLWDEYKTSVTK